MMHLTLALALHTVFLLSPSIFIWDFLILFSLCVSLSIAIGSTVLLRKTKRGFLATICIELVGGLAACCAFAIVYAAFIEPRTLVVTSETVDFPSAEEFRIVVLSDFHVGPYKGKRYVENVVAETNRLLPDFVFLVGDYLFDDTSDMHELAPLGKLRASVGVFAVLGNHDQGRNRTFWNAPIESIDHSDTVSTYLRSLGIRVLRNQHDTVSLGTEDVVIAGIDDLWTGHGDVSAALENAPVELPTILLAHNPDVIEEPSATGADLIVAGHTHGGQIRLPWVGPLRRIPIHIDQSYDRGVFPLSDNRWLAITSGVGETWARARLLAWPEILLLITK